MKRKAVAAQPSAAPSVFARAVAPETKNKKK
jgi:hypothetical protein